MATATPCPRDNNETAWGMTPAACREFPIEPGACSLAIDLANSTYPFHVTLWNIALHHSPRWLWSLGCRLCRLRLRGTWSFGCGLGSATSFATRAVTDITTSCTSFTTEDLTCHYLFR